MRKWIARILASFGLLLVAAFLVLRTPDTDAAAMRAKYGGALSHYAETPEARIHYRDQGPRDAPVLLLIHGAFGSVQSWEQVVARMQGKYRLISLDLPGSGLTGPNRSRDYRADAMIHAAVAVLDAAKVERAIWVGNSMGGRVAWRAALAVPNRVSALVLVDAAGAQAGPEIKPFIGARLMRSWVGRQLSPIITPRSIVKSSTAQSYARPERISEAQVDRYWELLRYPGNRVAAADALIADREPAKWLEIGKIHVPVLIIWGGADKVIPIEHGRAFAAAIGGAQLRVIADAGHLPMEEQPGPFVEALSEWLDTPRVTAALRSSGPHARTSESRR